MQCSGAIFFFQASLLIAAISCSPIFVRWDEFAVCLRRRLKHNFSPNSICATRKMAQNFRRSIRCPSCELFFHCQANYEAVFHCSQATEAMQTTEVFSDCREFAQFGGPVSGVSVRQEANLFGRRGGDCVSKYLTKTKNLNLATVLGLSSGRRCQWNPLEGVCGSTAGEPLLSNFGQKPPQKAPGILEALHALNVIKDKLPAFNSNGSFASHTDSNSVVLEPAHSNKPNTTPSFVPISVDDFGKPYIPLSLSHQDSAHSDKEPLSSTPAINPVDTSRLSDATSGYGADAPSETDPWLSSIASAFGSFFGKPPILLGHPAQPSNVRIEGATALHQRPKATPTPLQMHHQK
ncbi:serum amyloid A protein-like [Tropilaelaps mercedesae]|uniref:Serum amyloid A protein-like n=1 Tax=Tropilaelaps mercedesae TaxID=418985 RepID=A0A1V9XT26_9ACAR|nr:serum amyloid A protein-like [Tropilaelaps mercedesae]